jgi:hypothetical protein
MDLPSREGHGAVIRKHLQQAYRWWRAMIENKVEVCSISKSEEEL